MIPPSLFVVALFEFPRSICSLLYRVTKNLLFAACFIEGRVLVHFFLGCTVTVFRGVGEQALGCGYVESLRLLMFISSYYWNTTCIAC